MNTKTEIAKKKIIGQRFGRLSVTEYVVGTKRICARAVCQCDCGVIKIASVQDLKSGHTRSCGCLRVELLKSCKERNIKCGKIRTEAAKKNIIGQRFGRLLVTDYMPGAGKISRTLVCKCDCGNTTIVNPGDLKDGKTKSCGCLRAEKMRESATTHSMVGTSEYTAWGNMKRRCYNEKGKRYKDYGGRGITICASWLDQEYGFLNFFRDMGKKPSSKHSIDRIDNDGNYEPSNCRWSTMKDQNNNRRKRIDKTARKRDIAGKFIKSGSK